MSIDVVYGGSNTARFDATGITCSDCGTEVTAVAAWSSLGFAIEMRHGKASLGGVFVEHDSFRTTKSVAKDLIERMGGCTQ
jgi:hypothetical protein